MRLTERQEAVFLAIPGARRTPPADERTVRKLQELGLICRTPEGTLELTREGRLLYVQIVTEREG